MVVSVLTNGLALAIAMPGVGGGGAQAAAAALWGSAAHHACGAVVHGSQPHRPMAAGVYQLHALLAAVDLALAVACFIAPGTRRPPQDDKTEHGHNPNRPSMLSLAALLGNVLLLLPVHAVILDVQLGSTGGWAAFAGFPYTPELLAPSLAGDAAQRGVDVGFAMSNAASAASAVAFACFAGLVSATRGGAGRDVSGALLGALALHAGLVVSFVAFGSSAGVAVADAWAAAKIHASIGACAAPSDARAPSNPRACGRRRRGDAGGLPELARAAQQLRRGGRPCGRTRPRAPPRALSHPWRETPRSRMHSRVSACNTHCVTSTAVRSRIDGASRALPRRRRKRRREAERARRVQRALRHVGRQPAASRLRV